MVFNEKMYKDLLTERSTSKNDPGVTPHSTPKQRDVADSEFVELDDVLVKKVRSILKGNEELRLGPPTPQNELRRSTRTTRAPEKYSPSFHYLLLTDSGEPECYKKALQVEDKDK